MAYLNKVFLMGNLTRDPELRYTPSGVAICRLGLAVSRRYTTARGEEREEVCFVDIDVWSRQAETCNQYLRKGAPVFVEGRLRFDQWDDRDTGKKRSRITVTAERVQFLGQPGRSDFGDDGGPREPGPEAAPYAQTQAPYSQNPAPPRPQRPAGPPPPARAQRYQPNPPSRPGDDTPPDHRQDQAEMPPFDPVEESDDDIPF